MAAASPWRRLGLVAVEQRRDPRHERVRLSLLLVSHRRGRWRQRRPKATVTGRGAAGAASAERPRRRRAWPPARSAPAPPPRMSRSPVALARAARSRDATFGEHDQRLAASTARSERRRSPAARRTRERRRSNASRCPSADDPSSCGRRGSGPASAGSTTCSPESSIETWFGAIRNGPYAGRCAHPSPRMPK